MCSNSCDHCDDGTVALSRDGRVDVGRAQSSGGLQMSTGSASSGPSGKRDGHQRRVIDSSGAGASENVAGINTVALAIPH